jgi:hypothetical protein
MNNTLYFLFLSVIVGVIYSKIKHPVTIYTVGELSAENYTNFTISCTYQFVGGPLPVARFQYLNLLVSEEVDKILIGGCGEPFSYVILHPPTHMAYGRLQTNLGVGGRDNGYYFIISRPQELLEFSYEFHSQHHHPCTRSRYQRWAILEKKTNQIHLPLSRIVGPIC